MHKNGDNIHTCSEVIVYDHAYHTCTPCTVLARVSCVHCMSMAIWILLFSQFAYYNVHGVTWEEVTHIRTHAYCLLLCVAYIYISCFIQLL